MDRQYVKDHDLVERYLRDQLALEQAEAFEQYYLTCADTMEELELARALRCGMKEVRDATPAAYSPPTTVHWLQKLLRPSVATALACVFLVVAAVPVFFAALVDQDDGSIQLVQPTRLNLPVLRSAVSTFEPVAVSSASDTAALILVLEMGYSDFESHRVRVVNYPTGETVAEEGSLSLVGEGDLEVPVGPIPAGRYVALVEVELPDATIEEVGRYPFELR